MSDTETTTSERNHAHLFALGQLGFVHRRLPTGDPRNGKHFVPATDFNLAIPRVLVIVEDDETYVQGFAESTPLDTRYQMRFSASTPANVINQAVAAAVQA